jgi:hypothetical protein
MEDTLFEGGASKKIHGLGSEMHHWRNSVGCLLINEFLDLPPIMVIGGHFIPPHVKPDISSCTNTSFELNPKRCFTTPEQRVE